jgi:hypothetical protein
MLHTLQAECSTAGTAKRKIWRLNRRTISCVIPLLPLCCLEKCTEIKDVKLRVFKCYREQSLCHTPVVKVKLSLYTSCRHTGERRCNSSHFDLDTRWRRVVGFTPGLFTPSEGSPSIHWTGVCVVTRAGMDTSMNRKIYCPYWQLNRDLSSVPPVSYSPTTLSQLLTHKWTWWYSFSFKTFDWLLRFENFLNSIFIFFEIFNLCHDGSNLRKMVNCKPHVNSCCIWRILIRL